VEVRYRLPLGQKNLEPPWDELGYHDISFGVNHSTPLFERLPKKADFLFLHLACLQIGLLVVVLGRLIGMRWRREPLPRSWSGPAGRALLLGLVASLLLGGFVWAYEQGLRHYFGPSSSTGNPWFAITLGIDRAITLGTDRSVQVFACLTILLLAPLLHEVFFRGLVFGSWANVGWVWTGAVVSALAAAVLRLDWYRLPLVFFLGLLLAWLFRRTGSLLAPLTAHIAGNAVALGLVLGWIPNLPPPAPPVRPTSQNDLIVGLWEKADGSGRRMEFLPDGAFRTEMIIGQQSTGLIDAGRYEFVAPDRIRFRWPPLDATKKFILTPDQLTLLDETQGPDDKMHTKTVGIYKRVK
jgi:membrane protease YdiL (CAAX protease family)